MADKIIDIEGIGPVYAERLAAVGIKTTDQLLAAAATPDARAKLGDAVGVTSKLVLEWANRADLMRVKGIGSEYADLLEFAGVDTVKELAQRNAENLTAKMAQVNEEKGLVRRLPSLEEVIRWIAEAKTLPASGVTY
ncbi:MAG: DUF4332 domain-containing protein [Bacillota bacterium]